MRQNWRRARAASNCITRCCDRQSAAWSLVARESGAVSIHFARKTLLWEYSQRRKPCAKEAWHWGWCLTSPHEDCFCLRLHLHLQTSSPNHTHTYISLPPFAPGTLCLHLRSFPHLRTVASTTPQASRSIPSYPTSHLSITTSVNRRNGFRFRVR